MADKNYRKVMFQLVQDEEGYPPDQWESLWAYEVEVGLYSIDNIPIFVKGISSEDVVSVEQEGEELCFKELIRPSANSVFRLYLADVTDVPSARESFHRLGCESEQSHIPKLIAVEIPGAVLMGPVVELLSKGVTSGRWEYEQGVLRHSLTTNSPM